jgi:AraC-like DNA-binding protein
VVRPEDAGSSGDAARTVRSLAGAQGGLMTDASNVQPSGAVTLSVHDPDQAQEIGSRLYYPQDLVVLDRHRTDVTMSVWAARLGPIFLGELSYDADVRIDCGELNTSYHVNVPLRGRLATSYRGHDEVATPTRAAVYGPVGETVLSRWEAGSRQLCVKIDRKAVESALGENLGRELGGPVTFDPVLDLRSPTGRGWADMVTMISDQLHNPGSLVHQPLVGAPLVECLINGLLTACGHDFQDALHQGAPPCRPPVVEAAIDFIHAHAGDPITTTEIAAHCCIGVRALQEGFAKHLGRTPMQYLRAVRLRRAHEELLAADPYVETVSRIAYRWGFTNAGRFATAHEAEFGEAPSATLRRSR